MIRSKDTIEHAQILCDGLCEALIACRSEIHGPPYLASLANVSLGAHLKAGDEAVSIISLVAEKGLGLELGRQIRLGDVVSVATSEAERQRIAKGVDDHVDFRRKAAARAADGLVVTPFLRAPALCWCALTMVASIIAYSLSGSSAKVLKRVSQTQLAAQREKRLWVFFQSPKRSGKSRHGAPERNFQITASTNRRLPSSQLRPTVPGRPGRKVSIRANCRRAIHSASSQSLQKKAPYESRFS